MSVIWEPLLKRALCNRQTPRGTPRGSSKQIPYFAQISLIPADSKLNRQSSQEPSPRIVEFWLMRKKDASAQRRHAQLLCTQSPTSRRKIISLAFPGGQHFRALRIVAFWPMREKESGTQSPHAPTECARTLTSGLKTQKKYQIAGWGRQMWLDCAIGQLTA